VVRTALNLVGLFARISAPFIPFSATVIADAVDEDVAAWPSLDARHELSRLKVGAKLTTPEVLFKKIEDEQVAEWAERFGGAENQA
jgi:methionyl-tRNA synthetase